MLLPEHVDILNAMRQHGQNGILSDVAIATALLTPIQEVIPAIKWLTENNYIRKYDYKKLKTRYPFQYQLTCRRKADGSIINTETGKLLTMVDVL